MSSPDRIPSIEKQLKLEMQSSAQRTDSSNFTLFHDQFEHLSDKAHKQNREAILDAARSQYVRYKDERKLKVKVTERLPQIVFPNVSHSF